MLMTASPAADAERYEDAREAQAAEAERRAAIETAHIHEVCTRSMRSVEIHKLRLPTARGTMTLKDALWEILSDDELEAALYSLLRSSPCLYVSQFRTKLAEIYAARHVDGVLANGGFAS